MAWQLDDLEPDAVASGRVGGSLPGVALVDIGQLDGIAGLGLDRSRQPLHLGPVLGAGRRDVEGEHVAEGVHGKVQLGALLALGSVVSRPLAALGRGSQGPAVDDRRTGLGLPAGRQAQDGAQVRGQRLEATRRQPALRLLVDGRPRRKVVRHPAPRRASLHHVAQAVEHLSDWMLALRGPFGQERQVGRHQRPLVIGDVGRIRFANHPPKLNLPGISVHNIHNSL